MDTSQTIGEIDLTRYALGQGGLSEKPMIDAHVDQIAQLQPQTIRLFVQEYFNLYPKRGRYRWDTLDKSIEAILATGAKPFLCLCFKPSALYPKIDQDTVHPADYKEWEKPVFELVRHCNQRRKYGVEYWEVGNEPDIGEDGGCPYRFKPDDSGCLRGSLEVFDLDVSEGPKGTDFMAHWWNVMPQYDGLWGNQGRVRPAYYAFRLLSLIKGQKLDVSGTTANVTAFAARNGNWNHVVFWNFPQSGPGEAAEVVVRFSKSERGQFRFVKLDAGAAANNLRVVRHGSAAELAARPIQTELEPFAVGWIEVSP